MANANVPQSHRTPSLRLHRASGRGFVELNGRRIYLGKYGEPATEQAYHRAIGEWIANGRRLLVDPADLTVVELLAAFLRYATTYYRKPDGTPTSELNSHQAAFRFLDLYGDTPAAAFGPRCLKAVRLQMVAAGWCRTHVNKQAGRIKGVFKWAAENELVNASVWHALQAVSGLKRGRSDARESEPVTLVPERCIDAIQLYVSRPVWALIQLQLLTGGRAGELVRLCAVDLDTSGTVWLYRPADHKTAHHGHQRILFIGPRAQAAIQPFLVGRAVDAPLFSPAEAEVERRAALTAARVTPISCGNTVGSNRTRRPRRKPGDSYTVAAYRRAIHRACDRAGIARWSPNRLRHNAATRLRRDFGIEIAQTVLGHRLGSAITEIYAEENRQKAVAVIAKVG